MRKVKTDGLGDMMGAVSFWLVGIRCDRLYDMRSRARSSEELGGKR